MGDARYASLRGSVRGVHGDLRRHARRLGLVALALVSLGWVEAPAASAQDVSRDRDEEGRALFDAAVTAYEAGRYEDALAHFRTAYQASRRSALLYNIGQAADRLRRDAEAIDAFTEFLREVPDSPRRAQIEARIAVLRRAAPPDAPRAPPPAAPSAGPWVVAGAGLALLAAGLPMVLVASSDAEAITAAPNGSAWGSYEAAHRLVEPLSLTGQALTIAGAVALAAGGAWLVVELTGGSGESTEAALELTPTGVRLRGTL